MLLNYKRYLSLFLLFTSLAQADSFTFNSGGAFTWNGSVPTPAGLSATGNSPGDVRIVIAPFELFGWDGASWISLGGGGGGAGITSLNGLLGAVQTFASGTAGTDFAISSAGSIHTFNLPTASAVNRGALSSANWTTFNNKEPAISATTSADYYRGDKTFQPFDAAAQAASISQVITNGVTTKAPSEDAIFDALALKAPLASPALSGNPTAPTQAANDNSTKIATTAYADNAASTAAGAAIVQTIINGDTTHASSSDALFDALALKEPNITATTSADYYRGDKTFQPFDAAAQAASISQVITNGVTTKAPSEDAVYDALALKQDLSEKDQNNGYAGLDAGGKIAISALPNTVMTFEGQWNANTNTPALADGTGNAGDVWRANVAGTTNFGSGAITFNLGDWAVYNGAIWEYAANSNLVMSVNGQQGVVVLTTTNIAEGTNLYFTDARVIAAPITGFTSGAGVLSATDTILQAINKLDGNIGAASTGTANTFAGFDATGNLNPIATWAQNAFGGVNEYNVYTIASAAGDVKINNFESESDPTSAITGTNILGSNFDMHVGRLTSGFGTDGGITALNSQFQIANDGTYNNLYNLNLGSSYGDGIGGSASSIYTIGVNDTIDAGFTASQYRFINGGVSSSGTISSEVDFNFQSNGDVAGNYTASQISKIGDVTGGATGYRFDLNGDVTGTVYGMASVLQGTGSQVEQISLSSSQTLTGNFFGLNSNYSGNTTQNSYLVNGSTSGTSASAYGLSYNNSGATDYYTGISLSNNANGIHHQALNYSNSGDQTGNGQIINIQSSGDADNETGINVNLTGAYNTVKGLEIQVGSATTTAGGKMVASLDGGIFQTNSPLDSAVGAPPAFFNNNSVGGNLNVASGFPIAATPGFGNNLGIVVNFDDDYTADNFIGAGNSLGFSVNGFVNQITGATGKTFDTVNYMFAGGSNPSGDGTIVDLNFFRTAGLLNAGGNLAVTNMRGFYVDPAFDGSVTTTNKWGFINASSTSENWFKKNVVIGGTSGNGESGVELDVDGEARIRSLTTAGYVTTDATGHLSSIAAPSTPLSSNITANTTLAIATAQYYFCDTSGGAFTVTLPAASSNDGVSFTVKHVTFGGANDVTVATTGGNTIDAEAGDTLTAGIARTYISNGTEWFIAD